MGSLQPLEGSPTPGAEPLSQARYEELLSNGSVSPLKFRLVGETSRPGDPGETQGDPTAGGLNRLEATRIGKGGGEWLIDVD
eukprot:Skav217056  [mRNA]  locus=scaffold208:113446:113691:+ [translate_table: standard]